MVSKKTSEIIYDEHIYPRNDIDRRIVDRYRDAIDRLPPILIDKKNRIVDGYHRLMAYRAENVDEINVEILDTDDNNECMETAIRRNASHGCQLSSEDKKRWARELYKNGSSEQEISEILSVSGSAVQKYTSDVKESEKEERNQKIIDLYLSCHSEPEIAKKVGMDKSSISKILDGLKKSNLTEIQRFCYLDC